MSTATITADTPAADNSTAAPAATPRDEPPQLWQVPTFLAGVGALLTLWLGRPFGGDPAVRQLDREIAAARQLLGGKDAPAAVEHARRALERTDAFPDRRGEVLFVLGSAEEFQAERAPAAAAAELWRVAR